MLLVGWFCAVHVNTLVNGENAGVVKGGMQNTLFVPRYVALGPPAVLADTVVTAVAGYSD